MNYPYISTMKEITHRSFRRRTLWLILLAAAMMIGTASTARAQIDKLPHPDTTSGNFFGVAVSIDGERALVGASSEDTCDDNAGAAYIFERNTDTGRWTEAAKLVPNDCLIGLYFGRSVSLSGDRALVAAANEFYASKRSNAAYVFERDSTGTWTQTARLTTDAEEEEGPFAASVSLDGDRALVTTWGDPSDGRHGGAAYIFERDATTGRWVKAAHLTGSRGIQAGIFGGAAALDGDRAVVAASSYFGRNPGSIYIFERDAASGQWLEAAHFSDIDDFFVSVDIEGDRVLVGESKDGRRETGTATVYARDEEGAWRLTATLRPPTSYDHGAFGSAVSLSGNRALVVGYDEQLRRNHNIDRVVYIFEYDTGTNTWAYQNIVDIGEVAFGTSVDIDGTVAIIGHASGGKPGAAYVVSVR